MIELEQASLLSRIRAVIDAPDTFTHDELRSVLTDAGEAISMLQRVIAKHVREQVEPEGQV